LDGFSFSSLLKRPVDGAMPEEDRELHRYSIRIDGNGKKIPVRFYIPGNRRDIRIEGSLILTVELLPEGAMSPRALRRAARAAKEGAERWKESVRREKEVAQEKARLEEETAEENEKLARQAARENAAYIDKIARLAKRKMIAPPPEEIAAKVRAQKLRQVEDQIDDNIARARLKAKKIGEAKDALSSLELDPEERDRLETELIQNILEPEGNEQNGTTL
jgi:hypothetical protein